jgi:hypothetical protein
MPRPLEVFAKETSGKSYVCHRFCFESHAAPEQAYDGNAIGFKVEKSGETQNHRESVDLTPCTRRLKSIGAPPIFRFFLDGSRKTYKVDDIEYDRDIFPIVVAQLGVACCERVAPDRFRPVGSATQRRIVLAVPAIADANGPRDAFFQELCLKVNGASSKRTRSLHVDAIVPYDQQKREDGLRYENIAIALLHEHMLDMEKHAVHVVASERKLLAENQYLLKDGSLEYARSRVGRYGDISLMRNNFRFVVGVSKSFNAEYCVDEKGRSNASRIAALPLNHRTPALKFRSERSKGEQGAVYFVAWYLRLRDMKYTVSPFDGVVKVELVLTGEEPWDEVIDSEEIDVISSHLLLESLPTCYGDDPRWANHLYPVYLTEKYLKSSFVNDTTLINLL